MIKKPDSIIEKLVEDAIRIGADRLEVEYDSGHDEVTAFKGSLGIGIGDYKTSSAEGEAIRAELCAIQRRKRRITIGDSEYELSVRTYLSFNETAFRLKIKRV